MQQRVKRGLLKPGMFVYAKLHAKIAAGGKVIDSSLAGKWISPMHPEIIKDAAGTCDICGMPLVSAESLGFVDAGGADAKPPLVIPATAPLVTGRRAVVYVAVPGSKSSYESREISLGPRAGNYYIVESGLAEGERVVSKGAFKIDSSMQILAKPSMMSSSPDKNDVKDPLKHADYGVQPKTPPSPAELSAYFEVHKALFEDNLAGALKHSKILDARYSTALASSGDLKTAREIFLRISELLRNDFSRGGIKYGKPVFRFYCPMAFDNKGAIWFQDGDRILNPYFGSVMPACGELQETITGEK